MTRATRDLLKKALHDINEEKWDISIEKAEELYKIASGA